MIGLTTLLGSAQLAAQEGLRAAATLQHGGMIVPNILTISLRQNQFVAEWKGEPSEQIERFRLAIARGIAEFIEANRWQIGGFGRLVINLLLTDIETACRVDVLLRRKLYSCILHDSAGEHTVSVRQGEVVVGRDHSNPPPAFIPLRDDARQLSRKHLHLRYRDLQLHAQLLGHNPTTVNGIEMGTEPVALSEGDELACGGCQIQIAELLQ